MISACVITKDECENLDICLERLSHYPIEIVVVDTGSTDHTKKIAEKYTSNIYDFEWCNNFSAARNYAIEKATKDYILMIDTDEFVYKFNYDELIKLIKLYPDSVGTIHRKNLYKSEGENMTSNELISRLFPKSLYYYTGIIHEQVTDKFTQSTIHSTYDAPISIMHVGYSGNEGLRQTKALRNLRLLLKELTENPKDPYILYQIGKSHFFVQDYAGAIPYFEMALEQHPNTKLTYVRGMVSTLGYCLIYTKQYEEGLILTKLYDSFSQDADYLFVLGLIFMYNARFEDAVNSFTLATTIPRCDVDGVNSYLAYYNIGVILECLGDTANANIYYDKCGEYPPAIEGKSRCVK